MIETMDDYAELIKLTREVLEILKRSPKPVQYAVPKNTGGTTERADWFPLKGYEVAWGVNLTWNVEVG